jgi:NAD(P)-dependent dehydrogenase (short-subunit alcohol dehydrogenase family)
VARPLEDSGGATLALRCDVSSGEDVAGAITEATLRFGDADVLVNNAGTVTIAECASLKESEWDLVMDVNAKGTFLLCRAVIPGMLQRQRGTIVNVASQAGPRGAPKLTHYCASKAAVIGFSRALALELAPTIRVNALCPGIVTTDMMEREYEWEEELTGVPTKELRQRWLSTIPLGRFQTATQIARSVLFLASDDASEITGQALNVTGGWQ